MYCIHIVCVCIYIYVDRNTVCILMCIYICMYINVYSYRNTVCIDIHGQKYACYPAKQICMRTTFPSVHQDQH